MKAFIESIRTRFGDEAAHTATVYMFCREIMIEAGSPMLSELTSGILKAVCRRSHISQTLFNLIAKESDEVEQFIPTIH